MMYSMKALAQKLALGLSILSVAFAQSQAPFTFAVTNSDNNIGLFSTDASVRTVRALTPITGLPTSVSILGVDFRPSNQQLYGLGSNGNLYVISVDPSSFGSATLAFTTNCNLTPASVTYSINFNPVADALRILGSDRSNIRIPLATAVNSANCITDGTISYTGSSDVPQPAGVAYTNSVKPTPSSTAEYMIDFAQNAYSRVTTPNAGSSALVNSPLPFTAESNTPLDFAFDTLSSSNIGYLISNSRLYSVAAATGQTTLIGDQYPANVRGLSVISSTTTPAYIFAVTNNGNNIGLFSSNPSVGAVRAFTPITGLPASVNILGIDLRPSNQQVYGFGSNGALYTISVNSATFGQATLAFTTNCAINPAVTYSVNFNPVADALRVLGSDRTNLRIPLATATGNTASCLVDTAINYNDGTPTPRPTGVAYTNSVRPAPSSTAEYMFDASNNVYSRVITPNAGTSNRIASLPFTLASPSPLDFVFDSISASNIGFTIINSNLYRINAMTGISSLIGGSYPSNINGLTVISMSSRTVIKGGPSDNPLEIVVEPCFDDDSIVGGFKQKCLSISNLGYSTLKFLTIRISSQRPIGDVFGLGGVVQEPASASFAYEATYNVDLFGGLPRYTSYNKTSNFNYVASDNVQVSFFAYSF